MSIQPDDPMPPGEIVPPASEIAAGTPVEAGAKTWEDIIGPPTQEQDRRRRAASMRMPDAIRRAALRAGAVLICLVVVLAVGLAIVSHRFAFSRSAVLQRGARDAGAENVAAMQRDAQALTARLDAAESRIGSLEKLSQQVNPTGTPQLGDLNTRLSAVDSQLSTLQSQMTRTVDKDSAAALAARVGRLEADNSGTKLQQASGILALATLARAAQEGLPFVAQLAALQATTADNSAIALLRPLAADGAPTFATLQARFPDAARRTLNAERRDAAQGHVLARLWASMRSLVSIRRVGDTDGDTSEDRLARAGADLDRDDLAGAVMETRALTGAAANAIAPWRDMAEARLTVDRAVAELNAGAVKDLAGRAAALPEATQPSPAARIGVPPSGQVPSQGSGQTSGQGSGQTSGQGSGQTSGQSDIASPAAAPAPTPSQSSPSQSSPAQSSPAQSPPPPSPPSPSSRAANTSPSAPAPRALPRVAEPSNEIPEGARASTPAANAPLPPPP